MKKLFLCMILIAGFGFMTFGDSTKEEISSRFPWWLLLLALLAALLFLAFKRKKQPANELQEPPVQKAAEPKAVPVKIRILEEEEIHRYSYALYERRYGLNGDAVGDWYQAVNELTAYYEAQGYQVMLYWEIKKMVIASIF
jgi:hypothetical protein